MLVLLTLIGPIRMYLFVTMKNENVGISISNGSLSVGLGCVSYYLTYSSIRWLYFLAWAVSISYRKVYLVLSNL